MVELFINRKYNKNRSEHSTELAKTTNHKIQGQVKGKYSIGTTASRSTYDCRFIVDDTEKNINF